MRRYAEGTTVPVERTRAEIEKLVRQRGATSFGSMYCETADFTETYPVWLWSSYVCRLVILAGTVQTVEFVVGLTEMGGAS